MGKMFLTIGLNVVAAEFLPSLEMELKQMEMNF